MRKNIMKNYKIVNGCHNCKFVRQVIRWDDSPYFCNKSDDSQHDYISTPLNLNKMDFERRELVKEQIEKNIVSEFGICDEYHSK
jgi:hypothetical protein